MKTALLLLLPLVAATASASDGIPREWIDRDTGHRVVRLSRDDGSDCLYFTQYGYTDGGRKLLMTTPHGLQLVDLATRQIEEIPDTADCRPVQTGRRTGAVYYTKQGALYACDPATKLSRRVAALPADARIDTINADETLAAGAIEPPEPPEIRMHVPPPPPGGYAPGQPVPGTGQTPDKGSYMTRRRLLRLPTDMITVRLADGHITKVLHTTTWINHFQFSPQDPTLLSFAHEGSSQKVDRIWLLRLDGASPPRLVHQRTMTMEGITHEFWSADGKWIWYDMQAPRNVVYWLAGYNVVTGERIQYNLQAGQSSAHYNVSPDGGLFCGDGDRASRGARLLDSKWIFLFRPELVPDVETLPGPVPLIQSGVLRPERLVNLAQHDYSLEPNASFTPDGKWVVFRSNMFGPHHVFAVEVTRAHEPGPAR